MNIRGEDIGGVVTFIDGSVKELFISEISSPQNAEVLESMRHMGETEFLLTCKLHNWSVTRPLDVGEVVEGNDGA